MSATILEALVRGGIFVAAAQDLAALIATNGGAWGGITGVLANQADLQAALNAKPPFLTYLLSGNTAITAAAHGNRIGFINQAGATTQTFANAATSGATDGMVFTCINKGAGIMTAAGAITAQPGYKITARQGEPLVAVFDAVADAWVSNTPAYNVVQPNDQSANYTTTIADIGRDIRHPASDNNARTITLDSHTNVSWPDGACIGFINRSVAVLSIAVTTDTLVLAGTTTTGTRSLAQNGEAVAKFDATQNQWLISGVGLT